MLKSTGVDDISSTYALKTKSILAKPLTLLFNSSLKDNVIPNDWKKANVSPIFKNGEKSLVSNYRPISPTSFCGKVLDKIVKNHIERFLLENNIINNSQH